jgi:hypothetical protein
MIGVRTALLVAIPRKDAGRRERLPGMGRTDIEQYCTLDP